MCPTTSPTAAPSASPTTTCSETGLPDRMDCGHRTAEACAAAPGGCSWDDTCAGGDDNRPSCHRAKPAQCAVDGPGRRRCEVPGGEGNIQWRCQSAGCCWAPANASNYDSNPNDYPFCFEPDPNGLPTWAEWFGTCSRGTSDSWDNDGESLQGGDMTNTQCRERCDDTSNCHSYELSNYFAESSTCSIFTGSVRPLAGSQPSNGLSNQRCFTQRSRLPPATAHPTAAPTVTPAMTPSTPPSVAPTVFLGYTYTEWFGICRRNNAGGWINDGESSQGNQSPQRCQELCDAQPDCHSYQLNNRNSNSSYCGTFTGPALPTSGSGSASGTSNIRRCYTQRTRIVAPCTSDGEDRFNQPGRGDCCNGPPQGCTEARPVDDHVYCAPDHPDHEGSCWSTVEMCREWSACATPAPTAQPTASPTISRLTASPTVVEVVQTLSPSPEPTLSPSLEPTTAAAAAASLGTFLNISAGETTVARGCNRCGTDRGFSFSPHAQGAKTDTSCVSLETAAVTPLSRPRRSVQPPRRRLDWMIA